MKTRIIAIIALIGSFLVPAGGFAAQTEFSAGSLIIPMDSAYQPEADNGILEAYGLVYYLLAHTKDATDANGNIINDATGNPVQESDITVHWVIDPNKATIDGPDLTIEVTQTALDGYGKDAVVKYYNHDNTIASLAYKTGDSALKATYSGSAFVVDGADQAVLAEAKNIIAKADWAAVDVHVSQVPFTATVHRKMRGTPPKIALMDSKETGGGNAEILESYLRLAGICPDVYDVLTPYQVRDGALNLFGKYDFLWAPHWAAFEDAAYNTDNNGNSIVDADDIVNEVRQFIAGGKALFAECASIQTFEKSQYGHYLSSNDFGHNGGTNDPATIIYNDKSQPYAQVGDFAYVPEGGHLHNWRPFQVGDPYETKLVPAPTSASVYNDTVTRFTIDDGSSSPSAHPYYANGSNESGWDYYVGGYMDGDTNSGYVVYLGGHKYAKCSSGGSATPNDEAEIEFEFLKDIKSVDPDFYELVITYHLTSSSTSLTTTVEFDKNGFSGPVGDPLQAVSGNVDKKKFAFLLKNTGTDGIVVDSFQVTWTQSDQDGLKKINNTTAGEKLFENKQGENSGSAIAIPDSDKKVSLEISGPTAPTTTACTNNSDCAPTNVAGVRYVLNTLFNIGYTIKDREFVRSAPVLDHPYLYQGSFEYPRYSGHFRKYDITQEKDPELGLQAEWDTGDATRNLVPLAGDSNLSAVDRTVGVYRTIYTAIDNNGTWDIIDFDTVAFKNTTSFTYPDNPAPLLAPLNITPTNNDNSDEIAVVERIRGKFYNPKTSLYEELPNRLGGIIHSSPVIVKTNSRFDSRVEVAYMGDAHGMIHAIKIDTGEEMWGFIPPSLLGKLQNDRTDPNATADFAAVDGSPTARDIFYQAPGESGSTWHTILVATQGKGGTGVFAMDVTTNTVPDLDDSTVKSWKFLWEFTDTDMGHARRAAIGKVKWPILVTNPDTQVKSIEYTTKWVVFTATGFVESATSGGGINVYAIDLDTGNSLWMFSNTYSDAVNDMPGPITLFDTDNDTFVDRVYVGDMNGRMWELATVYPVDVNAVNLDAEINKLTKSYNPNVIDKADGTSEQLPLYDAGVGYPIAVSPAVYRNKTGEVVLVAGTGGTDWAADTNHYSIFAINATSKPDATTQSTNGFAAKVEWEVTLTDAGEKIWSAPTLYGDKVYLATTYGTVESDNPLDDVAKDGDPTGNLYKFNLDGTEEGKKTDIGKTRASVFVDKEQLYLTTIDNEVVPVGDELFADDPTIYTLLKAWLKL